MVGLITILSNHLANTNTLKVQEEMVANSTSFSLAVKGYFAFQYVTLNFLMSVCKGSRWYNNHFRSNEQTKSVRVSR